MRPPPPARLEPRGLEHRLAALRPTVARLLAAALLALVAPDIPVAARPHGGPPLDDDFFAFHRHVEAPLLGDDVLADADFAGLDPLLVHYELLLTQLQAALLVQVRRGARGAEAVHPRWAEVDMVPLQDGERVGNPVAGVHRHDGGARPEAEIEMLGVRF